MQQIVRVPVRRRVLLERVTGPCADTLAVPHSASPAVIGSSATDHLCPACHRVLCWGVAPGALAGLTLRCGCGVIGRVRG